MAAVLDWDLSSLGPPEMDLGWHFGLEFMMAQLFGQTVPGFPGRSAALDRYEERSGHAVRDLDWHEVFALVRALAINDRHRRVSGDPRQRDAVGRAAVGAAVEGAAQERDLMAEPLEAHRLAAAVGEDQVDLAGEEQVGVGLETHAVNTLAQVGAAFRASPRL